jgi:calcineurin-like phosphoesterase family protein
MDYISWWRELQKDADILALLVLVVKDITSEHDTKLQTLLRLIEGKIERLINGDNKKCHKVQLERFQNEVVNMEEM